MAKLRKLSKSEVEFIQNLQNRHIREQIISNPTKDDIRIIRNICSNVCKGRFKFNQSQKRKLIPHAKLIRTLGDPVNKRVHQPIAQSGEALGVLAPLIVELIKAGVKKLFKKAVPV
jgi:hypothetical protein